MNILINIICNVIPIHTYTYMYTKNINKNTISIPITILQIWIKYSCLQVYLYNQQQICKMQWEIPDTLRSQSNLFPNYRKKPQLTSNPPPSPSPTHQKATQTPFLKSTPTFLPAPTVSKTCASARWHHHCWLTAVHTYTFAPRLWADCQV